MKCIFWEICKCAYCKDDLKIIFSIQLLGNIAFYFATCVCFFSPQSGVFSWRWWWRGMGEGQCWAGLQGWRWPLSFFIRMVKSREDRFVSSVLYHRWNPIEDVNSGLKDCRLQSSIFWNFGSFGIKNLLHPCLNLYSSTQHTTRQSQGMPL